MRIVELSIAEMKELVRPAGLKDVLETLKSHGSIADYVLCSRRVLVWPSETARFDVALLAQELTQAAEPKLKASERRRLLCMKRRRQ